MSGPLASPIVPLGLAAGPVVDRDAYSTTTREGGSFRTRTYPEPVNFESGDGSWDAIDRTLVREADGSVHPAAVGGDAVIPASIARPVAIEHEGRKLAFDLVRYRTRGGLWFMTRTPKNSDRSGAEYDGVAPWSCVRNDCFNQKPNGARRAKDRPGNAPALP